MLYNAVLVGLAIAGFSFTDLATDGRWEPIVNLALGGWAVASPWVLGFVTERDMVVSTVVVGAVVAVISLWQVTDRYNLTNRLLQ